MNELLLARRRIAIFLVLVLFTLVLLSSQTRSADRRDVGLVGRALLTVLLPVQAGMVRIADGLGGVWGRFTEIGRLRVENTRLRAQVASLNREVAALREQAAAAQRLERLLELRAQVRYHGVAARVIGRDPGRWFSTVLIDRGSRDGIQRNAPVVTPEGVVGRVIEVTPFASRVLLIADARSAVGVVVQTTRDAAVVEGRGTDRLHLKYLSRAAQVRPGDLLVTSGLGGVFPRGLVVGRLASIEREEGALLQEAEVEPAAQLGRLEEVLVLLPGE
ncbi:MAG TPA: rod shape-determining protein MreC [bacterium]|nr:rod shape-determining protein MreC [bacterium]